MSEIIYPRSPRETMDGWRYLPRYIDKIRLHLAGKLHADYTENLGKGFDGFWLKAAGVTHEQIVGGGEKFHHRRRSVRLGAEKRQAHRRRKGRALAGHVEPPAARTMKPPAPG